jgi:hypothetical protein
MAASCFEEKPDLPEDARGGWILRQGHVILSLQRHKAGAGNTRSQFASGIEWLNLIPAYVHDQGRCADFR